MAKRNTKKTRGPNRDVYTEVTDRIVAELEAGVAPWAKPWDTSGAAGWMAAMNAHTKKLYRGVNQIILGMAMEAFGWRAPLWVTYKQAQEMGGSVIKGERSRASVVFWTVREKDAPTADDPNHKDQIPFVRYSAVFNIEQTTVPREKYEALIPKPLLETPELLDESERIEVLERFVANTGASIIEAGHRAAYSPSADMIRMPSFGTFKSAGEYYATLLHELIHWTGGTTRLDRSFGNRFGDDAYAVEELTAELGAAFLCAVLGVPGRLQHSEYLASWLKVLKADNKAIFKAATAAQAAADYILECSADHASDEAESAA